MESGCPNSTWQSKALSRSGIVLVSLICVRTRVRLADYRALVGHGVPHDKPSRRRRERTNDKADAIPRQSTRNAPDNAVVGDRVVTPIGFAVSLGGVPHGRGRIRALRIFHAGRNATHRARESALPGGGADITNVVPRSWPEVGTETVLSAEPFPIIEVDVRSPATSTVTPTLT